MKYVWGLGYNIKLAYVKEKVTHFKMIQQEYKRAFYATLLTSGKLYA